MSFLIELYQFRVYYFFYKLNNNIHLYKYILLLCLYEYEVVKVNMNNIVNIGLNIIKSCEQHARQQCFF